MSTPASPRTGRLPTAQFRRPAVSVPVRRDGRRWEGGRVSADLLARARDGEGEAFADLGAPHRRELHVHCYRILGSVADADDALQETLLSAWQSVGAFEGRSWLRTWLYRIATSR